MILASQDQTKGGAVVKETSTGLFDPNHPLFKNFLFYGGILLGVAFLLGCIWELIYRHSLKFKRQVKSEGR